MRPRTSRVLIPAFLLIALIVVFTNAWLAFKAIDSLLESEHWVEHTWQVISQVEVIMGSVKDAETGVRGYLISDDESYLQTFTDSKKELPVELAKFENLVSDNPEQLKKIAEMRVMIEGRMAVLTLGINLHKSKNADALHSLIQQGPGKFQMQRMRKLADAMEDEEHTLLQERTADARTASKRARYTTGVASLLDLLLITLIFIYLSRERRLRIAAEIAREELATAHEETERQADEVRLLNETLEQRVAQRTVELEAANRELEAFSYSVSHDLRAPLRTIDGFSLALEEDYADAVDATGRDFIRRVRTGVQRMGALIDALLQLSRITRGEMVRETFGISQLAEEVADIHLEDNLGREVEIHVQPDLEAEGDPRLLRIALENLMGNAVKFSSKKPKSVVDFGWDEEKQAWFVRDNGAGFDMFYADKLFNAFNRLHGDKDFKGSGIGLATVARVIHRHHGRIWAESVVDDGATFWFTLG